MHNIIISILFSNNKGYLVIVQPIAIRDPTSNIVIIFVKYSAHSLGIRGEDL